MASELPELLDDAVARGLISSAQRTQLLALATEGSTAARAWPGELLAWAREAPRGLNAISLAYGVGALVVLFALGWFLADRWDLLGPRGVLVVGLLYMALFWVTARVFRREGFATARGTALVFVVCTVPLVTWALLRSTGLWDALDPGSCRLDAAYWDCRGRAVVLAASAFVGALACMRAAAFGPLMVPGATALTIVLFELVGELARAGGPAVMGWPAVVVASVLATLAYETDRRRSGSADYGRWLHLAAAVVAAVALVQLFTLEQDRRLLLLPTALAMIASSLFLRRVVWLLLGLLALFQSLSWLAREVFKDAVAFPLILGFVGLGLIIVTVLVQRAYPGLAERVRGRHGVLPHVPGGAALLLAPALVAVLLFPVARQEAAWRAAWAKADQQRQRIIAERERPRIEALRAR
jgi:hypothetical protein